MRSIKKFKFSQLMKYGQLIIAGIVLLATIFFLITPLRQFGMIQTFDDVQVVRVQAMFNELQHGQFPVRMVSAFGHGGGYMLFNYYPPLVYYIGATFLSIGYQVVHATKLVFILSYFIAAAGMWSLCYSLTKKVWVATAGSLMLLLSAYFNFDAYSRGALAELFAFAMIPGVFWSFLQLRESKNWGWILLSSLLFSLLIYSHVITGFICAIFVALFCVFPPFKKERLMRFAAAGILTAGLCASLLLPLTTEKQFVIYDSTVTNTYKGTFRDFSQLGGIESIRNGFRAPSMGIVLMIVSIGCAAYCLIKRKSMEQAGHGLILASFSTALFLVHPVSRFVWDHVAYLKLLQFPYRFLTVITVFAILIIIFFLNKATVWMGWKILVALVVLGGVFALQPQNYQPLGYVFVDTFEPQGSCGTSSWENEILPKWVPECLDDGGGPVAHAVSGKVKIESIDEPQTGLRYSIHTNGEEGTITVRKYYFPGWLLRFNNQTITPAYTKENGIITFGAQKGVSNYELTFTDTPVRSVGNMITVISFTTLLLASLFWGVQSASVIIKRRNHDRISRKH